MASEIGAEEAEEVGVEHLLRDVKDTTVGTLSQRITAQLLGLKGLLKHVRHIHEYLDQVGFFFYNLVVELKFRFNNSFYFSGGAGEASSQPRNRLSASGYLQLAP